ncbi:hypothetical protein EV128_12272 [Rhizobium azibense]|nr:hypothetical protein EV128_12272 [Rhizobium azibense]
MYVAVLCWGFAIGTHFTLYCGKRDWLKDLTPRKDGN